MDFRMGHLMMDGLVGNSPEYITLYHVISIDNLHYFCFHLVLIRFVLDREGTKKEESNVRFSFSKQN